MAMEVASEQRLSISLIPVPMVGSGRVKLLSIVGGVANGTSTYHWELLVRGKYVAPISCERFLHTR